MEFVCEATRVAELIARTQTPVYLYSFEYVVDGLASNHVIHGVDTNFVFGNSFTAPDNHILNSADLALANSIGRYWTRFATSGNPNLVGDNTAVPWFPFQIATPFTPGDRYLILDSVVREGQALRALQCDFLKPFFFRSVVGAVPAAVP